MLSNDQILQFAKANTLTKHILQEYFQHEILDSFFKQNGSIKYSFIGGTAVRIMYGGQRFSEDLDFDTTDLTSLDNLLQLVIKDMKNKGIELEFRLIHKGAYHCYIKFPGVLHTHGLFGYEEEKLLVKFDATSTNKLRTVSKTLNNYGIFCRINVADSQVLLAKKLLTIESRKRPKGRDLYDVTFLWGMGEPDLEYLMDNSGKLLKVILQELLVYVATLNLPDLAQQTKSFLMKDDDADRILLFPQFIKQKLESL